MCVHTAACSSWPLKHSQAAEAAQREATAAMAKAAARFWQDLNLNPESGIRQQDTGCIDPALNRESKFTITGDQGLAGTAVFTFDLFGRQSLEARRRTCGAGAGQIDHPALVTFPFSAADTLKGYQGLPYALPAPWNCWGP